MVGSTSSPPSVLDTLRQLQMLGFCSNLNFSIEESNKKSQSSLFNRILSAFLEETHQNQENPPIPAKIRNGKTVDLFLLYQEVLENGGYDSITTHRQWGSVAKKIGCNSRDGLSMELVYLKYLHEFNRHLRATSFDSKKDKTKNSVLDDDDDDGDDDVGTLDSVDTEREISRVKKGKRKRVSLVGMLDWLLLIARRPWDPSTGNIEEDSAAGMMFSQLFMARQEMFRKRKQGSEKVIYPLEEIYPSTRGRCPNPETRGQSSHKDILASLQFIPPKSEKHVIRVGKSFQAQVPDWNPRASVSSNNRDELKQLGKQIWPTPQKKTNRLLPTERDPIGKGRQDTCTCKSRGSVKCVRFHVNDKRKRLKLELGPAFKECGFDQMGEEVAHGWTEEEEEKFETVHRLNVRHFPKQLWGRLKSELRYKRMEDLVSYFFNVFLLRRRRNQNRETPEKVNSNTC